MNTKKVLLECRLDVLEQFHTNVGWVSNYNIESAMHKYFSKLDLPI